jgi:hypothetical protein
MFRFFSLPFYSLLNVRLSNLLYQERRYVLPASQQIMSICGQQQVEATGGLVLLVRRTGLNNIPTFCISSGAV